ncbi:MAG: endolytic transglycosylase MltG [Bacteroidetes bacterium]|nr:endolytic transglycosylase MltG [Bacteroidota bacterium]
MLKNFELKKIFNLIKERDVYFISTFFGFFLGVFFYTFFTPNYNNQRSKIYLDVPKGAVFSNVVDSLYVKGVIPSKTNMKIAALFRRTDKKIKAGRYVILDGQSYFDLLELFLKGQPKSQKLVTIPEGIWQHNLAKLLKEELGIDSSKFMELSSDREFIKNLNLNVKNLEGYLLPDTYYFYDDVDAKDVLIKLESEMDLLFTDSVKKRITELGMTQHEVLTMASIIDAESNVISEFGKISSVYHNRLKKRIKLQADPTVQYLLRGRKRFNKVYFRDLEIDSPYNTYKYYGLPPGPINNPGKEAIIAALYPEEGDYYFLMATGNGDHAFAKTLAEHQQNVRKYREWRNSK